jgi:hypothetical protein
MHGNVTVSHIKHCVVSFVVQNNLQTTVEVFTLPLVFCPELESWNSAGLNTEFDIPAECAQNLTGIVFFLLCLIIPYRVRLDSVKFYRNLWKVCWNSMGRV